MPDATLRQRYYICRLSLAFSDVKSLRFCILLQNSGRRHLAVRKHGPYSLLGVRQFLAHASRKTSVRHARLFTMHIVRATAVRGRKFRRKSTTSTEMSYDLLSYAYIWKTFLFLPFLSFLVGYTEVTSFYTSPQHIKRYVT